MNDNGEAVQLPDGHFNLDSLSEIHVNDTLTTRQPRLGKVSIGKNNKNIVSKTDTPTEEKPFNWEQYLKEMDENKSVHIQLLAHFFRVKKMKADTKEEAQAFIKRHTKAASQVAKFGKRKVLDAIEECRNMERQDISWTMETVLKVLTK